MKNALVATKNFVVKHKTTLAVATVATTVICLQGKGLSEMNKFLKQEGLFDKYYALDAFVEAG